MIANPDMSEQAGAVLKRLREAATRGDRADFLEMGKEIEWFGYAKSYDDLYKNTDPNSPTDAPPEPAFKAKINRAAEYVEVIGPYLYPDNPVAAVTSADHARYWQRKRHVIEQQYINHAVKDGDLSGHAHRWVNQACTYGRGVMWTGFDLEKKITVHIFDTIDNLLLDADAKCLEELGWAGRDRFKPKRELLKLYPEMREKILTLPASKKRSSDDDKGSTDVACEMVEYTEFWFKDGLHHFSSDLAGEVDAEGKVAYEDSPKKYVLAGDVVLSCTPWEIPFHVDNQWPFEVVDLRERPGKIWPAAPLEPALPHLKALNWIYTLYLNRMHTACKIALVVVTQNGQTIKDEELFKILHGRDMSVVRLTINGESLTIDQVLQQFKIDTGVEQMKTFVELVGREFEKSSGLSEILYAGEMQRQPRSATEVDFKEKQSKNRIEEMRRRVQAATTKLMRKYIFAARYLQGPEDIGALFGPTAAQAWGTLASPEQCAQEQAMRAKLAGQIMQEAQMAAQQAAMMPPQIDPMTGAMMPPPPPPKIPTPDEIEEQLGPEMFVSMDEWKNEADRGIEAGSMRLMDHDAQVDNLNIALNQLAPAVANMPGGAQFVAAVAREFATTNRFSAQLRQASEDFYAATLAAQMAPPPGMGGPPPGMGGPPGRPGPPPPQQGRPPKHGIPGPTQAKPGAPTSHAA